MDDVVITYEDSQNGDAWEKFVSSLGQKEEEERKPTNLVPQEDETPVTPAKKWKIALRGRWQWVALAAAIVLVVLTFVIWKSFLHFTRQRCICKKDGLSLCLISPPLQCYLLLT